MHFPACVRPSCFLLTSLPPRRRARSAFAANDVRRAKSRFWSRLFAISLSPPATVAATMPVTFCACMQANFTCCTHDHLAWHPDPATHLDRLPPAGPRVNPPCATRPCSVAAWVGQRSRPHRSPTQHRRGLAASTTMSNLVPQSPSGHQRSSRFLTAPGSFMLLFTLTLMTWSARAVPGVSATRNLVTQPTSYPSQLDGCGRACLLR